MNSDNKEITKSIVNAALNNANFGKDGVFAAIQNWRDNLQNILLNLESLGDNIQEDYGNKLKDIFLKTYEETNSYDKELYIASLINFITKEKKTTFSNTKEMYHKLSEVQDNMSETDSNFAKTLDQYLGKMKENVMYIITASGWKIAVSDDNTTMDINHENMIKLIEIPYAEYDSSSLNDIVAIMLA